MFQLPESFMENKDGNIFLTAAQRAGWEIKVLYGKEANLATFSKNGKTYQIYRGILSVNNDVSTSISVNKYLTHLVLKDRTPFVTQPQLLKITDITDQLIQDCLDKYSKLVVKPVDENEGRGVTTSLTTLEEVKSAVTKVADLGHSSILLENHVDTVNEYRIMLWKDKAFDILRRIPAYVVGDDTSTIEQLVVEKNNTRLTQFNNIFAPIKMDQDYLDYLTKQGLSPTSVLEKGKHLTLETTCNLAQGGETERIDISTVHPDYIELFKIVYETTGLNHSGIDIISPNLTDKPQPGKTAINELNGAPACTVAFFADLKEGRPFYGSDLLLKKIEQDPPTYEL